ncbi:hypothetical protein [Intestinibacillus massiliensis]
MPNASISEILSSASPYAAMLVVAISVIAQVVNTAITKRADAHTRYAELIFSAKLDAYLDVITKSSMILHDSSDDKCADAFSAAGRAMILSEAQTQAAISAFTRAVINHGKNLEVLSFAYAAMIEALQKDLGQYRPIQKS